MLRRAADPGLLDRADAERLRAARGLMSDVQSLLRLTLNGDEASFDETRAPEGQRRLIAQTQDVPDIEALRARRKRSTTSTAAIFTLHLRPGHKWSDGQPFTAEDFRYYWEDVANNKDLSPFGLPQALLVDGEGPRSRCSTSTTVRYTLGRAQPAVPAGARGAEPALSSIGPRIT